jgi:hypothetical protein
MAGLSVASDSLAANLRAIGAVSLTEYLESFYSTRRTPGSSTAGPLMTKSILSKTSDNTAVAAKAAQQPAGVNPVGQLNELCQKVSVHGTKPCQFDYTKEPERKSKSLNSVSHIWHFIEVNISQTSFVVRSRSRTLPTGQGERIPLLKPTHPKKKRRRMPLRWHSTVV